MGSVVGENFCLPLGRTFFVRDDCLCWSAENSIILDGGGNVVFTVGTKGLSGRKVLHDAAGKLVCTMQAKVYLHP